MRKIDDFIPKPSFKEDMSERTPPKKSFSEIFKGKKRKKPPLKSAFPTPLDLVKEQKTSLKKLNEPEISPFQVEIALHAQGIDDTNAIKSTFSTSEMHALLNTLVSKITASCEKGIHTTTIFLQEEGLLKGSEITIKQYDTAPSSFQIELMGETQAINIFKMHLGTLQHHLQDHFPDFEFAEIKAVYKNPGSSKNPKRQTRIKRV